MKYTLRSLHIVVSVLVCLFLCSGCKKADPTPPGLMVVAGEIKLDGELLKRGIITIASQDAQELSGKKVNVSDGQYRFFGDQGIAPGNYVVRISATQEMDRKTKKEATGETTDDNIYVVESIPPQYNRKSELQMTVTADGTNKFDFDLKK